MGTLVTLWSWAFYNAQNGDVTKLFDDKLGARLSAEATGLRRDNAQKFVRAMLKVGFLEEEDEGSSEEIGKDPNRTEKKPKRIKIHNWGKWSGQLFQEREVSRESSARHRQNKESGDCHVTDQIKKKRDKYK